MASISCTVAVVLMICACGWLEKVVCIRPVGGAALFDAAGGDSDDQYHDRKGEAGSGSSVWKQQEAGCSPCAEVYVVRDEGETLQTISEKCHAPFILLDNPHVQDTDDISAGSVLLISSTHLPCAHL